MLIENMDKYSAIKKNFLMQWFCTNQEIRTFPHQQIEYLYDTNKKPREIDQRG